MTLSPDASLTADDGVVETSHRGLTYPLGRRAPGPGELIELSPGVDWGRLQLPGSLGHINIWLLADNGGRAIVDTGIDLPSCRDAWAALEAGPLAGERMTRVLVTHFHPDHVGLAGMLCARHEVKLWMTRGEWLTARVLLADARDNVPDEMLGFWRAAGWSDAQVAEAAARGWRQFASVMTSLPISYVRMRDGDRIEIGGRMWDVVVGCGHSPEHACLVDLQRGVMIAGDQVLPRISSNVSLGVTEPEGDPLGDWLASIAKLRALPADLLVLPAHGEPFRGLHTRLDALRNEHLARLDMLAVHLAEPRRAVDCFGRMFRRVIDGSNLGLATGETLAHLRRLEIAGRAVRDMVDGVWWYRAA